MDALGRSENGGAPPCCQHCDSKEVQKLADLLLEKLGAALLGGGGSGAGGGMGMGVLTMGVAGAAMPLHRVLGVKRAMLNALLRDAVMDVPQYKLEAVGKILDSFIASQQNSSLLNLGAKAGGVMSMGMGGGSGTSRVLGSRRPSIADQQQAVLFSVEERVELAKLVIRKFDAALHEYHCSTPSCGTGCVFAVQRCPHDGCSTRFSQRWWGEHDAACLFKIMPCSNGCGQSTPRQATAAHLQYHCPMRPVSCPYAKVGCSVEGRWIVLSTEC